MYAESNPYMCLQRLSMLPKVAVSIKKWEVVQVKRERDQKLEG